MIDWMDACFARPDPVESLLRVQDESASMSIATGAIPDDLRAQATALLASMVLASAAEVRA
jgi:hypothetical protein